MSLPQNINIKVLASSSKANAYLIEDNGKSILIDCGLSFKELQIKSCFTLSKLDMCLVSHGHKDHCKAIPGLVKIGVHCAMSAGTATEIGLKHTDIFKLKSESKIEFKSWKVMPFSIMHDAIEPLGFLILSPSGSKLCYATDTYYLKYNFKDVNVFLIECNYQKKLLLKNSALPEIIKERIITSHFEFENVKEFFRAQDLKKTNRIFLIHLSDDHSDPALFTKEIEEITGVPVYVA